MARWSRIVQSKKRRSHPDAALVDILDVIHYRCPLSPLEAKVLLHRYILAKGERRLAEELGVNPRVLNRATWRMKAKIRAHIHVIRQVYAERYL